MSPRLKLVLSLIVGEARTRPGRLVPGLLAMCVSVALVIWMMGSYDALVDEFDDEAEAYMGEYTLCIVPDPDRDGARLSPVLPGKLRDDEAVEQVDMARQKRLAIGKGSGGRSFDDVTRERMGIPSQSPVLVGITARDCPWPLDEGVWPEMDREQSFVGVLGSASAEFFGVKPGDYLTVRDGARVADVRIAGIVHQAEAHPDISSSLRQGAGPALASLFVPRIVFEGITGGPMEANLIYVRLKDGADREEFQSRWRAAPFFSDAVFADTDEVQRRLQDNRSVRRMKEGASSVAVMVLLACGFIIFTTLSMGVTERSRQLALMRAVGLDRLHVCLLVVGEGLLLSIPAFLLGCLGGMLFLGAGGMPGGMLPLPAWTTLLVAFGCSTGGAMLAAVVPAWRSTRLLPLEATMDQWSLGKRSGQAGWRLTAVCGLACWVVQPLALFVPGLDPIMRRELFTWLGYPALVLGTVLLAPVAVWLVEVAGYRLAALLTGVNPILMSMQLRANLLRSCATTVALTVGLGLYMAVQIWGYSMVVPFLPDKTMPDTLAAFLHNRYEGEELAAMVEATGIERDGLKPIVVEEPDIAPEQLQSPAFRSIEQKSIVLAGVPPEMMEGSARSLAPVFTDGDPEAAYAMLKRERALLIPGTFAVATGLKAGDVLKLAHPDLPGDVQDWTVAGVVSLPGWHWLTKTSGMRVRRGHFVAALAIADETQVRDAFGPGVKSFFWGNLSRGTGADLQSRLQGYLDGDRKGAGIKPLVKVTRTSDLDKRVRGMADRTIKAMSNLPLIALLIASLALVNTILASVNARRREFALMHAAGVTRSMLMRLVLCESVMIGVSAVVLSFGFAVVTAWCGIQVLRFGYVFGGVVPPLSVPWLHLLYGVLIVMGLCLTPLLMVRIKR